jgi:RNA polymerase sigma factor (TIGR02999 family)
MSPTDDVSRLLEQSCRGEAQAQDRLYDLVYQDLRRIARAHLKGRSTGTLGTTAMVHEVYLRLACAEDRSWKDRVHFLSVASRAMRQVLVDHARNKMAAKRGGGVRPLDLDGIEVGSEPRITDLIDLDAALVRLKSLDERLARVVEMRFFGGLSVEETAEALGVTDRTVKRDWSKARVLLHGWLRETPAGETG